MLPVAICDPESATLDTTQITIAITRSTQLR
jgi:hypothetical protein